MKDKHTYEVLIPLTVGEVIQRLVTPVERSFGCLNPLNSRGSDSTAANNGYGSEVRS